MNDASRARRLLSQGAALAVIVALSSAEPSSARAQSSRTDLLAPPATASPPYAASTTAVLAHVAGPATLSLETYGDANWDRACTLPCDVPLAVGTEFRVRGDGVRASRKLQVQPGAGPRMDLRAEPGGSSTAFVAGIVTSSVGGAALLAGLIVSLSAAACGNGNDCGAPASSGEGTAGITIAGLGAAAVIGGVVLMVLNPRSEISEGLSAWVPVASAASVFEPGPIMPVPVHAASAGGLGSTPTLTVPLLSHRF